jgi:hypothetical protein
MGRLDQPLCWSPTIRPSPLVYGHNAALHGRAYRRGASPAARVSHGEHMRSSGRGLVLEYMHDGDLTFNGAITITYARHL